MQTHPQIKDIATHVLVFMIVGINTHLKMSLGYFPTKSATAEKIYPIFWRAVAILEMLCLFVCGISLTSGQLVSELFPDCLKVKLFTLVLRHRGGDRIYEMRCLFVAVGPNTRFIVLPHWDNMSQAHMIPHPVTLY